MKKVHAVLFAFLMMTMSLAGCLSGDAGEDGEDGQDGMSGSNGEDGQDGINGVNGIDGMTTLIATSPEPEGVNCPNSGTKIDAGLDVNGNGALDSEEIDSTDYICDGGSSINNMLTSIVQTDDSLECTAGSKTIAHGLDNGDDSGIPANGIMETGEIDTRITECSKYSPGIFDMQLTYPGDPLVNNLIVYNNELYFEMFNNLWKTDGTVLGTTSLINSSDGLHPYDPSDLVVFNGELYFSARDVNDGKELWKTDGTESGTQKVINLDTGTDFFGGNCGSNPHDLVVLGDKLVFRTGSWGCFDRELYATDGTENGTIRLADTCDGCDDNIISMHVFNGELFFSAAFENDYNNELWKTDGTPDGTVMVKEINPGNDNGLCSIYYSSNGLCKGFIELDNYLYFLADSGTGQELWKTDGTNFNTVKVEIESATVEVESAPGYNFPGINESTIGSIYSTDNRIIVTSLLKYGGLNPNNYNGSVWAYDPIANNVTLIFGDDATGTDSVIQDFFSYGNQLFFEAESNGQTWLYSWAQDEGISPLNHYMEQFNFEEYLIDDDKIYLRMYCQKFECREYDGGWLIYNMSSNTREAFVNNDNPHTDYDAYQLTKFNDQIFFILRDRAGGSYDHLGSFDAHISTEIIMQ